jgi:hypothetical protein
MTRLNFSCEAVKPGAGGTFRWARDIWSSWASEVVRGRGSCVERKSAKAGWAVKRVRGGRVKPPPWAAAAESTHQERLGFGVVALWRERCFPTSFPSAEACQQVQHDALDMMTCTCTGLCLPGVSGESMVERVIRIPDLMTLRWFFGRW